MFCLRGAEAAVMSVSGSGAGSCAGDALAASNSDCLMQHTPMLPECDAYISSDALSACVCWEGGSCDWRMEWGLDLMM